MIISTVKLQGSRGINPSLIIEFNQLTINCFHSFRSQTHMRVTDRRINIPIPHFIRVVPIILSNDVLWLEACFCHIKISNFCPDRFFNLYSADITYIFCTVMMLLRIFQYFEYFAMVKKGVSIRKFHFSLYLCANYQLENLECIPLNN